MEWAKSQAQFEEETKENLQIQLEQLKSLEVQMGQMSSILLEEQQDSLPKLEVPKRVEVDAKDLDEIVEKKGVNFFRKK